MLDDDPFPWPVWPEYTQPKGVVCPLCAAIVSWDLRHKHEHWHKVVGGARGITGLQRELLLKKD